MGNSTPFRVVVTVDFGAPFFFAFDSSNQPAEQRSNIDHTSTPLASDTTKNEKTIKTHPRRVGSGLKRMRARARASIFKDDKHNCTHQTATGAAAACLRCSFLRRKVIIEKVNMSRAGSALIRHATLLFIPISISSMKKRHFDRARCGRAI